MSHNTDQGIEDSAILLLSLGEEEAANVLKQLSPKEVQRLGAAMATLNVVQRDRVQQVIDRFSHDVEMHSGIGADSDNYLRSVLTRALGSDKAGFLLDRILSTGDTSGIESLKWMDPSAVAELIRNEHPQILASIMVHLEPEQAAAVLNQFTERIRNDVLLRVATLDGIQPSALRELNDVLLKMLAGSEQVKRAKLGGIKTAAEILNYVGSVNEVNMLDNIREYDAELAQNIVDEMFTFDSLADIDDRSIQIILREIPSDALVIALKGASQELRDKVFKNMPSRASDSLREDLEAKGPMKLSEVEAQQKEILKTVRRLSDEGQVMLAGGGEDQYV